MTSKVKMSETVEGTFGQMQRVEDFLPPPEELTFREGPELVKVTLSLNKETVDFFKEQSHRLNAPYQRMIRNLLNEYVKRQQIVVDS